MKVSPAKIDRFVASPDDGIRAVLVYGPDTGLIRERADLLMRSAVSDLSDPFLVSELNADSVAKDPALLADEAAAMALTGGRRAVRVRDCGDSIVGAAQSMLAGPSGDSIIVLQAGELNPRSKLRQLFETHADAAAIPCYADDVRDLDRVIAETLAAENIGISSEANAFLVANLGSDRALTRSELGKLVSYSLGSKRIEIGDAMAVIGDSAALSLDDLCFAAMDGDMAGVDRALARSLQEGQSEVAILRAISRHLMRLQITVARVDRGEAPDRAVKSLRPPVFFKRETQFKSQMQHWPAARIGRAIDLVLQAEISCKSTGIPTEAVCGRTLLQLAALGRQARRARA